MRIMVCLWVVCAAATAQPAPEFITLIAAGIGETIPAMPKYTMSTGQNGARTLVIETARGPATVTLGENFTVSTNFTN